MTTQQTTEGGDQDQPGPDHDHHPTTCGDPQPAEHAGEPATADCSNDLAEHASEPPLTDDADDRDQEQGGSPTEAGDEESAEDGNGQPPDNDRDGSVREGVRVRVYPDTDDEVRGVVVDDFAESAGYSVDIGENHIADPARRWAVMLDTGGLVFVDSDDLVPEEPEQ